MLHLHLSKRNEASTTCEVFADNIGRLRSPGHAGVDHDVVLEAQRRQPLAREVGLLAACERRHSGLLKKGTLVLSGRNCGRDDGKAKGTVLPSGG